MKHCRSVIFLGLLALSARNEVYAREEGGSHGGNGGAAVVCYQADGVTIDSVELFDYWESKKILKGAVEIDLGKENLSVEQKIRLFSKRLEGVDPYRANRYLTVALSILGKVPEILRTDLGTTPINDDDSSIDPQMPCKKELFAVQAKNPGSGEGRFSIRKDLYESPKTSNSTRAGIILHETIYRETIEDGAQNSKGARMYNYLVASQYGQIVNRVDLYGPHAVFPNGLVFKEVRPYMLPGFSEVFLLDSRKRNKAALVQVQPNHGIAKGSGTLTGNHFKATGLKEIDFSLSTDGSYVDSMMIDLKAKAQAKVFGQWIEMVTDESDVNAEIWSLTFHDLNGETTISGGSFKGIFEVRPTLPGWLKYTCERSFSNPSGWGLSGCEKASSIMATIRDGQVVTTRDGSAIYFYDYGSGRILDSFTPAQPMKFRMAESSVERLFSANIHLGYDITSSANGFGVQYGVFAKPVKVKAFGIEHTVTHYLPWKFHSPYATGAREHGYFEFHKKFTSAEVNGLPVMVRSTDAKEMNIQFCSYLSTQQIPTESGIITGPNDYSKLSVDATYVSGQKKVFNLDSAKEELVTDQNVLFLKKAECAGYVTYSLISPILSRHRNRD